MATVPQKHPSPFALISTDDNISNNASANFEDCLPNPQTLDAEDPLKEYRSKFHIPKSLRTKEDTVYLCGNSLGLQPVDTKVYIDRELEKWRKYGVEGHFMGDDPWVSYDEVGITAMAKIVGAKRSEVVLMNTLTVNLHFMLTAFYRPDASRYKIVVEDQAFPSDMIALSSHIKLKGYDPESALLILKPRQGEETLRDEDIIQTIVNYGNEIALICLGGVNYYTGQVFDLQKITEVARSQGCLVGFDLAHAVGNVKLELNKWGPDFAVWCTYKYLNGGPGGIGGCFVHERYNGDQTLPRLSGWWSHEKETRFLMKSNLTLRGGAIGFQVSNPSILSLSSLRASLQIYDEVGMDEFVKKSKRLTGYMLQLLEKYLTTTGSRNPHQPYNVITPKKDSSRGCQLSLVFSGQYDVQKLVTSLRDDHDVITDYREPNCIRVSPNPFYNTYTDVFNFVKILSELLKLQ